MRLWRKLPPWLEFSLMVFAAVCFFMVGATILWAAVMPIPAISNFENRQVAQSTKIYDRTGNIVLYDVHGTMRRTAVKLEDISPFVQKAAIAVEDDTFYTNAGFRPLSFMRAILVDLTSGGYAQGGSTITQQVVKNTLLTQDKTIMRKAREIVLALRLTKAYTKDEILNTYLNETPYGGTVYGVQEASQYFFGVDAKDLDLAQAAYLAALPQAPTYFSPYGNHRDALDARKDLVLSRMKDSGFITEDEYAQAKAEKVDFRAEQEAGIKAPHFVFFIREYLEEKYGADAVSQGGLKVTTTLDYDLQQKAESAVKKFAPEMQANFNASNEGVVAIDPKTGQILSMIGSRDYFNEDIDGAVNVALARRQPGSSFKPFVYATALEKGYTPDTVIFDLPTQFSTYCEPSDNLNDTPPCYSPSNYDGAFKGPMTLRNAIAQSQNVPSVKVLYLAGIRDSISTAQAVGISTLGDADVYGLTLVLGGGEVTLLEMTSAYGVFANDGVRNPPTGILKVEDSAGRVLEEYQQKPTRVIEPQIARQMSDILSDNVARTPEFGANSPLYFPGYDVADKTGTTNDFHDVWVLGYTPDIAVGAWAGNNDNSPMAKKIAAFIIAPLWHEVMAQALEKYGSSDSFPQPAPDAATGSLAPVLSGNWNSNPSQGVHDILYWINKDNPRGAPPSNPSSDPQFARWEYPVQQWTMQNPGLIANGSSVPTDISAFQGGTNDFNITSPSQGASFPFGAAVTLSAYDSNPSSIRDVTYYVNGAMVGISGQMPYTVSFSPLLRGPVTLRAVAQLQGGGTKERSLTFVIQ
jgi:1A family penicillin-binding protein